MRKERGATLLEMTLVGIPIMFSLIGTFEVSRAMWIYDTLAYAAREGTRFAIVHGTNCGNLPNNCAITQSDLGNYLSGATAGLLPDQLTVSFCSNSDTIGSCTTGTPSTCTLTMFTAGTCCASCTTIPSAGSNAVGQYVAISLSYPLYTLFLGTINLPAYSQETIQF